IGNKLIIDLTMNVDDNNKLNELHNKWYDEDNPPKIKKSFWVKITNIFNPLSELELTPIIIESKNTSYHTKSLTW
ncbi:MAG: hypothetical protein RQ760_19700, partial [Sedimentisphaerales bacterium]|nr:hypothetical protein [Sedimentisphaerales bacterium]